MQASAHDTLSNQDTWLHSALVPLLSLDGDNLVQPISPLLEKPMVTSASPGPGAQEVPTAACLLMFVGHIWTEFKRVNLTKQ
jgi:hypothetical protein